LDNFDELCRFVKPEDPLGQPAQSPQRQIWTLVIFCGHNNCVAITFDQAKREWTLRERKLDFADAEEVFAGDRATWVDDRFDYGETRYITAGWLKSRLVVMVWTQRGENKHVISMRHCHAKEESKLRARLARPPDA
jgi:uncharacterized DUF497 family protein